jgi:hypothetical protein
MAQAAESGVIVIERPATCNAEIASGSQVQRRCAETTTRSARASPAVDMKARRPPRVLSR